MQIDFDTSASCDNHLREYVNSLAPVSSNVSSEKTSRISCRFLFNNEPLERKFLPFDDAFYRTRGDMIAVYVSRSGRAVPAISKQERRTVSSNLFARCQVCLRVHEGHF